MTWHTDFPGASATGKYSLIGLPNLLGKQRLPPSASSGLQCLPVFRPGKTFREIRVATTMAFSAWFEARSEAALGRYTPQVEHYLTEIRPHYRWREDVIFCGRRRVEYHLNMVGTETLNRVFRQVSQHRAEGGGCAALHAGSTR